MCTEAFREGLDLRPETIQNKKKTNFQKTASIKEDNS